ncbi:MAG: hypothetical protein AB7F25_12260 [Deferribacterales bacterium]
MGEVVEIMKFEGAEMMAHPSPEHGKVLSTADVAKGYGCKEGAIRSHLSRHADEIIDGKHFITVANCDSNPKAGIPHQKTYWTPRGIMRLGMFIKSDRAKRFRDWAEDVLLSEVRTARLANPEKRLDNISVCIARLSRASKDLELSKSEKIAMIDALTTRELGYSVFPAVEPLPDRPAKTFMSAICGHDLMFFDYLNDDERVMVKHAFAVGRIAQNFLISIYREYTKNYGQSSKAAMVELRENAKIGEAVSSNGARYIQI